MTGRKAPAERWVVRCVEYTTKPVASQEDAQRLLEHFEKAGYCGYPHEVVKVS